MGTWTPAMSTVAGCSMGSRVDGVWLVPSWAASMQVLYHNLRAANIYSFGCLWAARAEAPIEMNDRACGETLASGPEKRSLVLPVVSAGAGGDLDFSWLSLGQGSSSRCSSAGRLKTPACTTHRDRTSSSPARYSTTNCSVSQDQLSGRQDAAVGE